MLKNKTRNIILTKKVNFCSSAFSKFRGLMFSKEIKDKALVFVFDEEKKVSLHMFFVFYPIDVLFLDKNKKIVELKKNFKPFRTHVPNKKAKYVVELPNNTIEKTKTEVNDEIVF